MNKQDVVRVLLKNRFGETKEKAQSFACANIALCKYWGKRNEELNLPMTPSLSISLGNLGTTTTISPNSRCDEVFLQGKRVDINSKFWKRTHQFLELFRPVPDLFFSVHTQNTVATSAGMASSASGFAALALALNDFFSWNLDHKQLSILARLGSGSACRSICSGFVEWHAGALSSGMDSFAVPLDETWPELRVGVLEISAEIKNIGSREAMRQTVRTSGLYHSWPQKVEGDLIKLKKAINEQDFSLLGSVAECNALSMHATMIGAWPPILYWLPKTVGVFHQIWGLRNDGLQIYFTIDAGPNIKLLFLLGDEKEVKAQFPSIKIVAPFIDT